MTVTVDTAVIGGGIVGWTAAYRLARKGQRVAVIDNAHEGQATAAGAGIISPGSSIRMPRESHPLSKAAVDYYPTLIAELNEDGETNSGFATPGTLFVFQNEEEYSRLAEIRTFAEQLKSAGFRNIGDISSLTGAEAKLVFPPLAEIPGALHMSDGARVDGRLFRDALRRASISRGATEINGLATLTSQSRPLNVLSVGSEQVNFESLLLAGGAWMPALGQSLNIDMPIAPQRGQILHLEVPDTDTSNWSIIHGFHNHYLLSFPTNRVVVGATREEGTGYDYRMTAGGVHQELEQALRVAPGLASATLSEIRVGFRPSSGDTLPILGQLPSLENVFVATGHGPSGLQLGPVSGAAVADTIMGLAPGVNLAAYSPARFN